MRRPSVTTVIREHRGRAHHKQRNETETGCNNTLAGGRRIRNSTVVKEIGRTDLILIKKKNQRTDGRESKYRDLNNDAEMTTSPGSVPITRNRIIIIYFFFSITILVSIV